MRLKFTPDLLITVTSKDNANLIGEYAKTNRESLITFRCSCGITYTKQFRLICENGGAFCKHCTDLSRQNKQKCTMLVKYGVENASQNQDILLKKKNIHLTNKGTEYPFQLEIVKHKIKAKIIHNFGVENISQSDYAKKKKRQTTLLNYGVENPSQSQEILTRKKVLHLKTKGTEYPSQLESVKQKIKSTTIRIYGVQHISQLISIKNKKREKNLLKYGVENPMQNPFISHTQLVNSYNRKNYITPSGILRYVQGYEPFALDELFQKYIEIDILTNRFDVPRILYDKTHYYYPDIYIVSENKIIEVKSSYTYEKCKNINEMKRDACISLGYSFEFWIFDNKRNKIVIKELESMHIQPRIEVQEL